MINSRILWAAILAGDAAERAAWEAFLCDRPMCWLEQRP
jgi:hypothetical protein